MGRFSQLIQEWGRRSLGDILIEQFRRFVVWWKIRPPNPWPEELDAELRGDSSKVLCRNCMAPQQEGAWFCPRCGTSVGPYNNTMPFVNVFSTGEMLRAGTSSHLKRSKLVAVGYLLIGLSQYILFAPFFLYRFFKNWNRPRTENQGEESDPWNNGENHEA